MSLEGPINPPVPVRMKDEMKDEIRRSCGFWKLYIGRDNGNDAEIITTTQKTSLAIYNVEGDDNNATQHEGNKLLIF